MANRLFEQLDRIEKLLRAQKEILNVDDLAIMTGWSRSFVYKQSMAKIIPHYKVREDSRKLFFKRTEIEGHLTKYKVQTVEELEQEATNLLITKKYAK